MEDKILSYFKEYIGSRGIKYPSKSDFERAVSTCYFDIWDEPIDELWDLWNQAEQMIAHP
jgi:hypothetical protein